MLAAVHTRPGLTRAEASRVLGIGTGGATEVVGRLVDERLLAEGPAAPGGGPARPGRCPRGPPPAAPRPPGGPARAGRGDPPRALAGRRRRAGRRPGGRPHRPARR